MKDSRSGESLWFILEEDHVDRVIVYCTYGHVDVENEVVRRALASSLQRDGVADSLGDGFKFLESGSISHEWVGELEGEIELVVCGGDGVTYLGDEVLEPKKATVVVFKIP